MARLHTETGKDTGIFWRVKPCEASRANRYSEAIGHATQERASERTNLVVYIADLGQMENK